VTWQDFGAAIEAAIQTALDADACLKTGGTYSVVTREAEPPQVDDEAPELWAGKCPYIGYRVREGGARITGTRFAELDHEVQFRVICEGNTPAATFSASRKIAHRIGALLRSVDGSAAFLSSAHQVLVSGWEIQPPEILPHNPYVVETICTVTVTVAYPEG
jgi:hypothetical protein